MAKRGRPTKYTPTLAESICERLSSGESLTSGAGAAARVVSRTNDPLQPIRTGHYAWQTD